MWKEENDHFQRAPTPKLFDKMIADLEDNDSVLFQSMNFNLTENKSDDEEIEKIREQIEAVTVANAKKDKLIEEKNKQIEDLKKKIQNIQGTQPRASTSQEIRSKQEFDLVQYYKNQYELVQHKYLKLKEALSIDRGTPRKCSSARTPSPYRRHH